MVVVVVVVWCGVGLGVGWGGVEKGRGGGACRLPQGPHTTKQHKKGHTRADLVVRFAVQSRLLRSRVVARRMHVDTNNTKEGEGRKRALLACLPRACG